MSESGLSENEEHNDRDEDDDDDDDDDDEWSGQDDDIDIEAVVLRALGGDLSLAAYLIPILHRSFYADRIINATQKVAPWRNNIIKCSPDGSTGREPSLDVSSNQPGGSRKKRRRESENQSREADEDEDRDDDDEDNGSPQGIGGNPDTGGHGIVHRLACPFHKFKPAKYGIQRSMAENSRKPDYRTCAGPGFKTIQRLK
jgi:hypothetical protein